jgi:hypothetical protein
VGWWATVVGFALLALSTHLATIPSALIAGSMAGAVALGMWLAVGPAESALTSTTLAVAVSVVAGAGYGLVARTLQNWPAWPVTLPAVWLAMDASTSGALALPRVDPVAISQITSELAANALALASGPAAVYLLGVASCCLAVAVAGMRRWAQARTVVGCLAVALASLGVLLTMEAAIHAHDIPPSSSMPVDSAVPELPMWWTLGHEA